MLKNNIFIHLVFLFFCQLFCDVSTSYFEGCGLLHFAEFEASMVVFPLFFAQIFFMARW